MEALWAHLGHQEGSGMDFDRLWGPSWAPFLHHFGIRFVIFLGSLSGGTLCRHFGSNLGLQAAKRGAQEAGPCAIRTRIMVFREGSTFSAKMASGRCQGALGSCRGTILG